jgi:hypothetical protein
MAAATGKANWRFCSKRFSLFLNIGDTSAGGIRGVVQMLRARVETAVCVLFSVLTVMTAIWPDWIEETTGLDPDAGSGALEWGLVVVLGAIALAAGVLARRDRRLATS